MRLKRIARPTLPGASEAPITATNAGEKNMPRERFRPLRMSCADSLSAFFSIAMTNANALGPCTYHIATLDLRSPESVARSFFKKREEKRAAQFDCLGKR